MIATVRLMNLDRACNDACGNGVQRCVDGRTRCDAPNPQ